MIRLDGSDLEDTLNVIHDGLGLLVDSDYVNEVLTASVMGEIMDHGAGDTLTASLVCNQVSQGLIGRDVPTYGDGPEVAETFWQDLHEAARACNIRVVSDTNG